MSQPVIYVHGYGSSGNTETAVNLRRLLGNEFEVISPTYDGATPLEAARLLEGVLQENPSAIVVGTSLGGFFANYLALTWNVRAVIVNPSLRPSATLHKYGENERVLAAYKDLEAMTDLAQHRPPRIVVVGLRDDVVDPRSNGLTLKDGVTTVMLDMGHRIAPAFYDTIAGLVLQQAQAGENRNPVQGSPG